MMRVPPGLHRLHPFSYSLHHISSRLAVWIVPPSILLRPFSNSPTVQRPNAFSLGIPSAATSYHRTGLDRQWAGETVPRSTCFTQDRARHRHKHKSQTHTMLLYTRLAPPKIPKKRSRAGESAAGFLILILQPSTLPAPTSDAMYS